MTSFLQSLCGFGIFKSKDLRKSSLNKTSLYQKHRSLKVEVEAPVSPIMGNKRKKFYTAVTPRDSNLSSRDLLKKDFNSACQPEKQITVTEKDFAILQVINSGTNSKVYLVKKTSDNKTYAMKIVSKKKFEDDEVLNSVTIEKEILEKAKHPFIPQLAYSFENDKKFCLVMEFVEGGGSLHHILKQLTRFSEEITRFYAAEILLTLEYLHTELKVSYSDIDTKNFLLDKQGHIKLIHYGQSKKLASAIPEVLKDSPNSSLSSIKEDTGEALADFWDLGCLIYQMITGTKPYYRHDDPSASDDISPVSSLSWPCYVSKAAKDLITRLLTPVASERLGYHGIDEIKKHAFFTQVNWEKTLNKAVYPPLLPSQVKEEVKDFEDEGDEIEYVDHKKRPVKPKNVSAIKAMDASSLVTTADNINAMSFDKSATLNSGLALH